MIDLNKVSIDYNQTNKLIELIKKIDLPPDKEESVTGVDLSEDIIKNLYFVVVAISHQTSPHGKPRLKGYVNGNHESGWDYLRLKWLEAVNKDSSLVYPKCLSSITADEIRAILHDSTLGDTIYDPEKRADLLNDLGARMLQSGLSTIEQLYSQSKRCLKRSDGLGLLHLLSQFSAYRDPIMKKSIYFLSLMKNHDYWEYKDEENLGSPVDYHEVRGHLRYGTVKFKDKSLEYKVWNGLSVNNEEDLRIRKAVYKVIMHIAKETGLTPSELHYFFWHFFRYCCPRESPHCLDCGSSCRLPPRYANIKNALRTTQCIFTDTCKSASSIHKIYDHIFNTDYY